MESSNTKLKIGVLALQGAFEEHQKCLEAIGCSTIQVRTPKDLNGIDGIILPGGESTAMGLIGTSKTSSDNNNNMWDCLKKFDKPIWGTCAGMILLAEKCIGTSAVIQDGQALIGGIDITVCRNYFGSQISSFEMDTPSPPNCNNNKQPFPGVFIRAPAILSVSSSNDIQILGKVIATPCRQAAITLQELERKIQSGENVIKLGVVDALERRTNNIRYKVTVVQKQESNASNEEKKDDNINDMTTIALPGAADGTNAREVICAVRKDNLLCTAFHPELTDDYRWHEYFVQMVIDANKQQHS